MIRITDPFLFLETKNTVLILEIKEYLDDRTSFYKGNKCLTLFYYGSKEKVPELIPTRARICPHGSNDDYNFDFPISSTYGNGSNVEPSLIVKNTDGTFVNRFFYEGFSIESYQNFEGPHARGIQESLVITEIDSVSNLRLRHVFSICEEDDVIISRKEIQNNGNSSIHVQRFYSLELPLSTNELQISTFDGAWLYERTRHIVNLKNGVFSVDSKSGSSSHKHNPFIEAYDEKNQYHYGFNLIYSGNHKETIEVNSLGHSVVMTGINDFLFDFEVKPNDSFVTPEAIMTLSTSRDQITRNMHSFVINHIISPVFANKERPVIFNNWEGTAFNINETSLLEMAEIAKYVGVEQFVMDDGWFKNRVNDHHALGDWVVDKNKFPNGLRSFSNKIKELGLLFGIWVEPEMISIDSDIYRKHPEYASIIPNREPIERRYQLMIDMANPKVVDYLFESLSTVFDECKPDYVKWDYNRFMTDPYSSSGIPSGEYFHRFIMGTYRLIEKLTMRYPNTLFESCASGGGRFDLGMLYYMPQTWGSDDTNTYLRSFITCGTLTAYPQSTFGAHVSRDGCPLESRGDGKSSLEDRFNLHSIGAFGYEFDFRKFSKDEIEIMKKQVEYYKKHRALLQYGDYSVVDNCFDDNRFYSFITVSKSKEEAMLVVVELERNVGPRYWKCKGLIPEWTYDVSLRPQYNVKDDELAVFEMSGAELMNNGIGLNKLDSTNDKEGYRTGVFSRMIYIQKKK